MYKQSARSFSEDFVRNGENKLSTIAATVALFVRPSSHVGGAGFKCAKSKPGDRAMPNRKATKGAAIFLGLAASIGVLAHAGTVANGAPALISRATDLGPVSG